jgi:glycosyltransferase involved in cell wall biosynthesis
LRKPWAPKIVFLVDTGQYLRLMNSPHLNFALQPSRSKNLGHSNSSRKQKILYFVTEDWYFWSHRLPLALAAQVAGFEITVVTRVSKHGQRISAQNLNLIPIKLSRRGGNLLQEFRMLWTLVRIYRRERPHIVHHVALKPVLYGSVAARIARVPVTVNALAGLGYLFTDAGFKTKILRTVVQVAFRLLLNRKSDKVILQNPDDLELLSNLRLVDRQHSALIKGSGVDTQMFYPIPENLGDPLVVLASRMLWEKGVGEFVHAAKELRLEGSSARFVLVGRIDPENPGSISEDQLRTWSHGGEIEWWGHRDDIAAVLRQSHIVCLPSYYGEGVPKVLIEAASCGRPIITTDTPGCREIVRDGENGILIPPKDISSLVIALRTLISDPGLRKHLGERGRAIVESEFSIEKVVRDTIAIYHELSR